MLPEVYPEIAICWEHIPGEKENFKKLYERMAVDHIDALKGNKVVAMISISNVRRVIPVAVSDDVFLGSYTRLSQATLISDFYYPAIFLESDYYKTMLKNPVVRTNLYHEAGHLSMQHFNRNTTMEEIAQERTAAKNAGEVVWQEREADAFATHYVGKKTMLQHLNYLQKVVNNISFGTTREQQQQEIRQRIQLIEELENV